MDDVKKPANTNFASNLLFTFDSLVDLDLGMLKFFKLNFPKSKYVDSNVLNNDNIKYFQALLVQRTNKNPLNIFIKPEYADQLDSLYNEIYEKNTRKIILLSPFLSFSRLLINLIKIDYLNRTILCKNKNEEQYCNMVFSNIKTIQANDKSFDAKTYDAIYLKNIDDLQLFNKNSSNVYVYNYIFNMERGIENLPKLSVYGQMLASLKLHLATPYSDYIKPI